MLHTHIAFLRKFYISGLIATSFLLAFISLAIFPVANSFSGVQAASVVSETSLTMTTSDIALALSVDSATGTFSESDSADFSVTTNNYSGYTLSVHAATDDENYSKLVNGSSVLNSISAASSESSFNNGNWGFKPSKLNSAANTDFQPAPTYEGTTIDTTAVANNEANTYDISIGAKADYGLAAGKYSNTFVITAIANPVGYAISYSANTGDPSVAGIPSTQTGEITTTSVELSSNSPTRTGYGFIDWCDGTVTNTLGVDSCTGTVYAPGDTYDMDQTGPNVLTLKAMWEQDQTPVQASATINYNGNGLTFNGGTITNTVKYVSEEIPFITQYSHTSNIADDGTQNGGHPGYDYPTEVISFDDAAKLHVTLTYSTTNSDNWLSMWSGNYPENSAYSDYASGLKVEGNTTGKYTTGDGSSVTIEFDVNDSAITFGWRGRYSGGYGYYAVITAEDSRGMPSKPVLTSVAQGNYSQPIDSNDYIFIGWAETNNAVTPTYRSEQDVMNYSRAENGDTLDLYAVLASNVYQVSYDKNGGEGTNFSEDVRFNTSVNLAANTFTKTGYLFNGWNTRADGKGQGFGNQDRYDVPGYSGSGSNSLSLYAQWLCDTSVNTCSANEPSADGSSYNPGISLQYAYEKAYTTNPGAFDMGNGQTKHGLYYPVGDGTYAEATSSADYQRPASELRFALQDIELPIQENGQTYSICQYATAIGSDAYVLDLRDYKSYHIRKMADGRCWFVDNLALDITNATVQSRMANRTNATSAQLSYLFNGGGTASDKYATLGVQQFNVSNYESFSYSAPQVYTTNSDITSLDEIDTINGWKRGALYNFCAASAGTYCYGDGLSTPPGSPEDKENTAVDTDGDICPTGWRLPTGRDSEDDYGEYDALFTSYMGTEQYDDWDEHLLAYDAFRSAFRVSLPGVAGAGGSLMWENNATEYWTASIANNYSMTAWYTDAETMDWDTTNRHYGGSVRCITQQP